MAHNIIEFNGKRYDALTGAFLGETHTPVTPITHKAAPELARHRGRSIDGFITTPKKLNTNPTQPHPIIPVKTAPPPTPNAPSQKPVTSRRAHKPASHITAHNPQHAKTLMRTAVSKPKVTQKPALKVQPPTEMAVPQPGAIAPKLSVSKIDPSREHRAQQAHKSEAIQKFGAQPAAETPSRAVIAPVRPRIAPVAERPHHTSAKPSQPAPVQDPFEAAIAHATSHEQQPPAHLARRRRAHRRTLNTLAGVAAFLIIGGFVAYLNLPAIEMRVASVRTGFHASLPTYQPAGFTQQGRVKTASNQVTVSFHSPNGSGYKLTQQPSSWNSATLYDNVVAITDSQHQTVEINGRTIYLYDDTNATWVNGGVWYQITGNTQLEQDQVARIASSL